MNQPRKQYGKGKGQWVKKAATFINDEWKKTVKLSPRKIVYSSR